MLVIRLTRVGKTKQPTYRIVVQDKLRDPWGKAIEILGQYNPRTKPKTFSVSSERVKTWIAKGAKPSPTLHNLLVDAKIIDGPKLASGGKGKKKAEEKK
jgi:small subunit ribosomal protein S16